jgi:photosystem II stability/assembly factor-like uncharacterized protein
MHRLLYIALLFITADAFSQKDLALDTFRIKINSSLRGLSVVNDQIVWLSGSNGYVCRSLDGGQTFDTLRIPGYHDKDFRDIEAFDDRNAVVMAIGSPAIFLRTSDGGQRWKLVYKNDHKNAFFNGMDFWDEKRGLAFSDAIEGKLLVIKTEDGGRSWKEVGYKDLPIVQEGESGFAASGTSIRCVNEGHAFIATGGRSAHLFTSSDFGKSWKKNAVPIKRGKESSGIFSIAFKDSRTGVIAGGDYQEIQDSTDNCFLTYNAGRSWKAPLSLPGGYRSCIEYISQTSMIITGTNGTEWSRDGGNNWKKVSDTGFHTVRKAKKGNAIYLSGNDGLFGVISGFK